MEKAGRQEFESLVLDLSMRQQITDTQRDVFMTFYGIPTNDFKRNELMKYHSLNMFYFYSDDEMLFDRNIAAGLTNNAEKLFRNTLRKEMYNHLKFTKKIRQLDFLNRIANPDKIVPASVAATTAALAQTFIGIKKKRYMVFCEQIIDFTLGMISRIYWDDLKDLKRSQYNLLDCIEYVVPIVYKMEKAFSQVLDEEFDTSQIEKAGGFRADKSITNVEKPLKVKRKRKTKKTKEEIPEKAEEDEKD